MAKTPFEEIRTHSFKLIQLADEDVVQFAGSIAKVKIDSNGNVFLLVAKDLRDVIKKRTDIEITERDFEQMGATSITRKNSP